MHVTRDFVNTQTLIGTGPNPTRVGVHLNAYSESVGHLLQRFAERRWQAIDLNAFNMRMPSNLKFSGAMVNWLATNKLSQPFLERGVPMVRVGNLPHPDDRQMPAVIPDHVASGRLAAEHFAERGFKHVGFVGYKPWRMHEDLFESFRQRAEALNCQCHLWQFDEQAMKARVNASQDFYDVQRETVCDWWRTLPRPLGMLAGGDHAAYRYGQWAEQAGMRVPEDIAILGIGNLQLTCEGATVPLSSIDLGQAAILDAAINKLGKLIAGQTVEACTRIAPKLVVTRRSTDVLAATNPQVAAALRYMWDHITENLSVEQIVKHVGVSRRTLEVGFQRELKRGINAELQRRRLEKACDLLLQTDWRVGQVAEFLGYNGLKAFSKAFRAAYGQSPIQYRDEPPNQAKV